jgi:hypothetical protein
LKGIASDVREEHQREGASETESEGGDNYATDEFNDDPSPDSVGNHLRELAREAQGVHQPTEGENAEGIDDGGDTKPARSKREIARAKRVLKESAQSVRAKQLGRAPDQESSGSQGSRHEEQDATSDGDGNGEGNGDESDGFSSGTRDAQDAEDEREPMSSSEATELIRAATKGDAREVRMVMCSYLFHEFVSRLHEYTRCITMSALLRARSI